MLLKLKRFSTTAAAATATPFAGRVDVSRKQHMELLADAPIRAFFESGKKHRNMVGMPLPVLFGRPWFARELRTKSFEDLHALHFILLKERNKLLSEKLRRRQLALAMPSPERFKNVRASMARLQTIMGERARADAAEREQEKTVNPEKPPKSALRVEWERKRQLVQNMVPNRKPNLNFGIGNGSKRTANRMRIATELEDTLATSPNNNKERTPVRYLKMPHIVSQVLNENENDSELVKSQQDRYVRMKKRTEFLNRTVPRHQELRTSQPAWLKAIETGFKTKTKPSPNLWPKEGTW